MKDVNISTPILSATGHPGHVVWETLIDRQILKPIVNRAWSSLVN